MNHIRTAALTDVDPLVTLENQCFETDKISRARFFILLKKKSITTLVSEYQNRIVGYAMIFFRKNSKKARIYSLAVDPLHRNKHIATDLHHAIEKATLERQGDTLRLEVHPNNVSAIQFYKKHHYKIIGTYSTFYEDGSDAIRMEKKLCCEK
jgi:ribosomal protein S18 acetylase RimI-like enzyme